MDPSSLIQLPPAQWSSPSSDSELYSVSSPEMVSPAPSMDLSSSPCFQHRVAKPQQSASRLPKSSSSSPSRCKGSRRSRLKNASEQRQNASEKEKLRMRDLTKALHHLRTYLPPSVAPVGQTLTKIETLRLTIRYISYLSDQLGLSEEHLSQRKRMTNQDGWQTPEVLGCFQCRSTGRVLGHDAGQERAVSRAEYKEQRSDGGQYSMQIPEPIMEQIYSSDTNGFQPQQCAQFTQSCQVYGYQFIPQGFWS